MSRMMYTATDRTNPHSPLYLASIDNEHWLCVNRLPKPDDYEEVAAMFRPMEVPKDNLLHMGTTDEQGNWWNMTFTTEYIKRWGKVTFHKPIPCP